MLIGVGVSHSIVSYFNVSLNGLSRLWKRDRTDFSAIVYLRKPGRAISYF